jgi:hypothetical protein
MRINLQSRRGESSPLAFLLAFPVWWIAIGLILILGYWYWAQAANMIGLNRSAQMVAIGRDGESARKVFVGAALGGFASDYAEVTYQPQGRATLIEINQTVATTPFGVPKSVSVQSRVLTRVERFYPRPPDPVHVGEGWE